MTVPLATGDKSFFGSCVVNLNFWGIIDDGGAPMVNGSMELTGDGTTTPNGTVVIPAIRGPQGIQGESSEIVKLQYEQNLTSASELPELTDTDADIGKAWWINNVVFVWSGTDWFPYPLGVPGPVGNVPEFTWAGELVPSNTLTSLTQPIAVKQEGTPENPSVLFRFDKDSIRGETGPTNGPLRDAQDYDNSGGIRDRDAIVWDVIKQKWKATKYNSVRVPCFSVPEGAFQSITNSTGGNATVCTYAVPPQPFAWRPMVFGCISASQAGFFNLFQVPMNLGCSVTLGDPLSGYIVGRGFGNVSTFANIMPHFSSPGSPNTSIAPVAAGGGLFGGIFDFVFGVVETVVDIGLAVITDVLALFGLAGAPTPVAPTPAPPTSVATTTAIVPANHVGNQGTIYVEITNDGQLGTWQFQSKDAQLLIMCVPVAAYLPVVGGLFERFSGQGQLTATAIHTGGS